MPTVVDAAGHAAWMARVATEAAPGIVLRAVTTTAAIHDRVLLAITGTKTPPAL